MIFGLITGLMLIGLVAVITTALSETADNPLGGSIGEHNGEKIYD